MQGQQGGNSVLSRTFEFRGGGGIFTFAPLYSQYNQYWGVVGHVGHNNDRRRPTKCHALHVTLTLSRSDVQISRLFQRVRMAAINHSLL